MFKTRFLIHLPNGSLQRPTLPLAPVEDKNVLCTSPHKMKEPPLSLFLKCPSTIEPTVCRQYVYKMYLQVHQMDLCTAACTDTKLFDGPIHLYKLDETLGAAFGFFATFTASSSLDKLIFDRLNFVAAYACPRSSHNLTIAACTPTLQKTNIAIALYSS